MQSGLTVTDEYKCGLVSAGYIDCIVSIDQWPFYKGRRSNRPEKTHQTMLRFIQCANTVKKNNGAFGISFLFNKCQINAVDPL